MKHISEEKVFTTVRRDEKHIKSILKNQALGTVRSVRAMKEARNSNWFKERKDKF